MAASNSQTPEMEPLVSVALAVGLVVIWLFAARQIAAGRRRFWWVMLTPVLLGQVLMMWIAARSLTTQPLLSIVIGLIAVPSFVLLIRRGRQQAADVSVTDPTWTLSSAHFDYIVWTAIGVPFVAILGIVVLLIVDALGGSG
jgi:hypothetical protein